MGNWVIPSGVWVPISKHKCSNPSFQANHRRTQGTQEDQKSKIRKGLRDLANQFDLLFGHGVSSGLVALAREGQANAGIDERDVGKRLREVAQ